MKILQREYDFINLFRALAAFWVLSAHCMIWGGWYWLPLPSAKIAVDLFMVISGYLMMASTRKNNEQLTSLRNWFRFWLRRLFRLAPAYYISLTLAIITSSHFLSGYQSLQGLNLAQWTDGSIYDPSNIEYTITNILLHLSFLFGLLPSYSFSTFLPDWSLSLEMQFYFVFPLITMIMKYFYSLRATLIAVISIFATKILVSALIFYPEPSFLLIKLNCFFSGIILYKITNNNEKLTHNYLLMLCALFLVSIESNNSSDVMTLPLIFLTMLVLGAIEINNRTPLWLSMLIHNRIIKFASDTSYAVYLFHGFFISLSGLIISRQTELMTLAPYHRVMLMLIFVITLSYLTAFGVYHLIELPMIRLGKQLIEKILPKQI